MDTNTGRMVDGAGEVRPGLEGVIAFETALSDVDGERGKLVVRGHDVEALAMAASFEDVVALLFDGALPGDARRGAVRAELSAARGRAFARLDALGDALARDDGMDALRAGLAHLAPRGDATDAIEVIGAISVLAAAWARGRRGLHAIEPAARSSHAEDYLRMLSGERPAASSVRALDAYLVTVADHGMNASTFTARVIASTGSDLISSLVGAVGALKGPLHGGAPGPVLDMLDAIGSADRAETWLEHELGSGRRIMGMGHRIYRVRDPRAAVLEAALLRLEAASETRAARHAGNDAGCVGRLALARAVESAANGVLARRHPDRALRANVEFYTAVLLDSIGVPRAVFSPTFAVGRAAGWAAHVLEQRRTGRLVRPGSRYVGPVPTAA